MIYHPVTSKIIKLLKDNNCWYETFEHEPVRTSEEAAKVRTGYTQHQGAKSMIIKIKSKEENKKFAMVVLPGDLHFDSAKVKKIFKVKDFRLATEEEVSNLTDGVQPGGVPPFGNLFNLQVIIDPIIFENEKMIFNAGDRKFSVAMLSQDYKRIVKPEVIKIVCD